MGMSGAAVFIRNETNMSRDALMERFTAELKTAGYTPAAEGEGNVSIRLHIPVGKGWFAVCEDENDPGAIKRDLQLLQAAFDAPMFSAELVDSDFITLSLYRSGHVAGTLTIGEPYWGEEPCDYDSFAQLLPEPHDAAELEAVCTADHVFAEDGFLDFAALFDLNGTALWAAPDIPCEHPEDFVTLHLKKPAAAKNTENKTSLQRRAMLDELRQMLDETITGTFVIAWNDITAEQAAEQITKAMQPNWRRTERDTDLFVHLIPTETGFVVFSSLLAPVKIAAALNLPVYNLSANSKFISMITVMPDGKLPEDGKLHDDNPENLPVYLERYGIAEEDFRAALKDGTGCIKLNFEKVTVPEPTKIRYSLTDEREEST